MDHNFDVVITGGGLAGLTLALQLHREIPDASVAVVERTKRPLPTAAHKVGESSVEVGSHYFGEVVGLRPYLEEQHLHKNGLRFYSGDNQAPIEERPEMGPGEFPIVPSFQLDRGKFENDLRGFCEDAGVCLFEGKSVQDIAFGEENHEVRLSDETTLRGRWVVDASGRQRLIGKKLDLKRPSPNVSSAAWFRIPGHLKIADLVPEEKKGWHQRDVDGNRWLSTVHLMGTGYWVWLIPLSTGHTSIGIVASEEHHAFPTFATKDKSLAWIAKHEPMLSAHLQGLFEQDTPIEDFVTMPRFSYLAERFISEERWACVGEAALFIDPLYSYGSDFLGMANSYTVRCIADERAGKLTERTIAAMNDTLLLMAKDAALTLTGNGRIFPHGDVFGAKLWWDFFNYWSFQSAHFFQGIWRESTEELERFIGIGSRFHALNQIAQRIFKTWAELKGAPHGDGLKEFIPLPMFPSILSRQHLALEKRLDKDATHEKMVADLSIGEELVREIIVHALRDLGPESAKAFREQTKLDDHAAELKLEERFAQDALPRRERHAALPSVARDLERALGRPKSDIDVSKLWSESAA